MSAYSKFISHNIVSFYRDTEDTHFDNLKVVINASSMGAYKPNIPIKSIRCIPNVCTAKTYSVVIALSPDSYIQTPDNQDLGILLCGYDGVQRVDNKIEFDNFKGYPEQLTAIINTEDDTDAPDNFAFIIEWADNEIKAINSSYFDYFHL